MPTSFNRNKASKSLYNSNKSKFLKFKTVHLKSTRLKYKKLNKFGKKKDLSISKILSNDSDKKSKYNRGSRLTSKPSSLVSDLKNFKIPSFR